jgi:MarR family transcriptional regulator, 2-MHQ and catechol-resistance regulon repressor
VGYGAGDEGPASTARRQRGSERRARVNEPCSGTTLVGLVLETAGGLRRLLDPRIEDQLGVGGQSFEILLRLSRSEGGRLRMSDLAVQTGITRSGLTHALDRLDEAGLVCREACSSDRRGTFALLTSYGNERMAVARAQHERDVAELLDEVLTEDDTAALAGLLRRLRDRVNAGALSGSGEEPVVTPLGSDEAPG